MVDRTQGSISLVRYDAACRALANARDVDEVKDIRARPVASRNLADLDPIHGAFTFPMTAWAPSFT